MAKKPCICGKTHRKLDERQCLLKGELERVLKLACRIRDRDECQWCGKQRLEAQDCQLSHVFPRGRDGRLKYDLQNVKLLCFNDHKGAGTNGHGSWHEDPAAAWEWFSDRFPDRVEYLNAQLVLNASLAGTIPIDWYRNRYYELKQYIADNDPAGAVPWVKVGRPA